VKEDWNMKDKGMSIGNKLKGEVVKEDVKNNIKDRSYNKK